jgi:hypothetical protein
MDAKEARLTRRYNAALDAVNRAEKDSHAATLATVRLVLAHRALKNYQARKKR